METHKLPIRAVPYEVLQRKFWNKGRPYITHDTPRPPRPIEVPVEEMDLEQLKATQWMEPLTESRKAFLETGVPNYTLDAFAGEASKGSLMDTITYKEMVPYTRQDPNIRSQIEWEKYICRCGPTVSLKLVRNPDNGKIVVLPQQKGFFDKTAFLSAVKFLKNWLLNTYGENSDYDHLQERIDLIGDELDALGWQPQPQDDLRRYANDQAYRTTALLDRQSHSAYENAVPATLIDTDGDTIASGIAAWPVSRGARSTYWHQQVQDPDELEIGTYHLYSEELLIDPMTCGTDTDKPHQDTPPDEPSQWLNWYAQRSNRTVDK